MFKIRSCLGSAVLLAIIIAISIGVGVAHYIYRTGDTQGVRQAIDTSRNLADSAAATALDTVAKIPGELPKPDTPLLEQIPDLLPDLGSGKIRVYFAPCAPASPTGIDDAFIRFLDGAQTSIFAAFFELSLPEAARVLVARKEAGVDVRLVTDSQYENEDALRVCMAAGIPVTFETGSAFMHNKFCIVDGERVWTGSTNITENGMYRNNNNALLIESKDLSANYIAEFSEMFEQRQFGRGSPRNTPFPEITIDETRIECYFAPEDRVEDEIVNEIRDAGTTIDVMAFSFTSEPIAKAMATRLGKGVRVRALFETRQAGSQYSQDDFLAANGAEVYMDTNGDNMHHKVLIIDKEVVVTGSYNFSKSANTQNDENVLILHSPVLAERYIQEFESLLPPGQSTAP